MAEMLSFHRTSLDISEPNGRAEDVAYARVMSDLRSISESLRETAGRMEGYRDLPMGTHDEVLLNSVVSVETFARFLHAERELMEQLQKSLEHDEPMLEEWRNASGG